MSNPGPAHNGGPRDLQDSDVLLLQQQRHLQEAIDQQLKQTTTEQSSTTPAIGPATQQGTSTGNVLTPTPARRGPGSGTAQLTAYERGRARTLYFDAGRSMREIVQITGYSLSQVRTAIQRAVPGRRPGRPRKDGSNYAPQALQAAEMLAVTQAGVSRRAGSASKRSRREPAKQTPRHPAAPSRVVPPAPLQMIWPVAGNQENEESSDDLVSDDEDDEDKDGHEADAVDGANSTKLDDPRHADGARPRGRPQKDQQVLEIPSTQLTGIDTTKTIVLVTGASSGIGHAIVAALCLAFCSSLTARQPDGGPYHVFLADRSFHRARDAARGIICHHGNTVSPLLLDMQNPRSVVDAARQIHEAAGRIDILVLNNGDPRSGASKHGPALPPGLPGAGTGPDPVSVLRHMLEAHLVSSYAVSEGLKWLLMAQPVIPDLTISGLQPQPPQLPAVQRMHKTKRLIHVTSALSSIAVRQQQTHASSTSSTTHPMAPPSLRPQQPHQQQPALAEYRMALAALNMLAACQASAAQAAGVRVGVWNSDVAVAAASGSPRAGGGELDSRQQQQERAASAGKAFVKVVSGERDGDMGGFMDTHGGWIPW
ncbi:hypothetical protein Micbo1qcDRAFT_237595 [Microdochium bolleyi]|uniref:Uncharacterized protein n=1 Tax=Microdochium bolleyi TaxID=196109 RepID=A0A136IJE2_9PEZI|nr:hypothetical protein Micbo1qcDRAFT_237595 [Microdochium bolleyi]